MTVSYILLIPARRYANGICCSLVYVRLSVTSQCSVKVTDSHVQ